MDSTPRGRGTGSGVGAQDVLHPQGSRFGHWWPLEGQRLAKAHLEVRVPRGFFSPEGQQMRSAHGHRGPAGGPSTCSPLGGPLGTLSCGQEP